MLCVLEYGSPIVVLKSNVVLAGIFFDDIYLVGKLLCGILVYDEKDHFGRLSDSPPPLLKSEQKHDAM